VPDNTGEVNTICETRNRYTTNGGEVQNCGKPYIMFYKQEHEDLVAGIMKKSELNLRAKFYSWSIDGGTPVIDDMGKFAAHFPCQRIRMHHSEILASNYASDSYECTVLIGDVRPSNIYQ